MSFDIAVASAAVTIRGSTMACCAVISMTMTKEVKGACVTPAKYPHIPRIAKYTVDG